MARSAQRGFSILGAVSWGINTTHDVYEQAKQTAWKTATLIAVLVVLLWLSVFIYGSFYYAYLPVAVHTRDVNLQFRAGSCDGLEMNNMCTFPTANLSLLQDSQTELLSRGQAYQVTVHLEMPQDATNLDTGMFMVNLQLYTHHGVVIQESSRATMLRYRSWLLEALETLLFFPLLTFNYVEQRQVLPVELISVYLEDPYKPTVGAVVSVQSRHVHFYEAKLHIRARFSGVRYMLSNWPVVSAVIGISISFFFLSILALLSWYNFLWTPPVGEQEDYVDDLLPLTPSTVAAASETQDIAAPAPDSQPEDTQSGHSEMSHSWPTSSSASRTPDEDWEDIDQSVPQEESLLRRRPISK